MGVPSIALVRARDGIAYRWVEVLGHPGRPLAPVLGVGPQAVYQAATRAAREGRSGGRSCRQNLSFLAMSPFPNTCFSRQVHPEPRSVTLAPHLLHDDQPGNR